MNTSRKDGAIFVALEGLSGTGKTETAKQLASALRGRFLRLTAGFEQPRTQMIKPEHVNARKCLFVSAMLLSSVRIAEELARGISIVVDGFLPRTLAYHDGMGASVRIQTNGSILVPDYSCMLVCDEDERLNRITRRARDRTIWDDIEQQHLAGIRKRYLSCNFPIIDTTHIGIEQVTNRLINETSCLKKPGRPLTWQ